MTRAAVVLFVESDHKGDEVDVAYVVNLAMQDKRRNGMKVRWADGREVNIKIVNIMEAGMAARNGYLKTEVSNRAWKERGL